jgi:hypothetical protein
MPTDRHRHTIRTAYGDADRHAHAYENAYAHPDNYGYPDANVLGGTGHSAEGCLVSHYSVCSSKPLVECCTYHAALGSRNQHFMGVSRH